MKNLFILIFLIFICCLSTFAQREINGRVVEIIDGKTVVIEVGPSNKITAQLQFIEVPEADQPLYQTVKDHLERMLLGQKIALKPQRLIKTQTIAQIFIGNIDASQQMIRDGAAWYAVEQKSGQEPLQSEIYQKTEAQAKLEKLGVWSIADLKPAWQIRAERVEAAKQQEILARAKAEKDAAEAAQKVVVKVKKPIVPQSLNRESQILAASDPAVKLPPNINLVGGLLVGYDPAVKLGLVATPLLKANFFDQSNQQTLAVQILYLYYDANESKGRQSVYLVCVDSESPDYKFLKSNDLIVTADNQKLVIGKAKRFVRKDDFGVKESLVYEIKNPVFKKIADAQNLDIKVGGFSRNLKGELQMTLHNLLQSSL